MKKDVMEKWVKALRSGDYTQGKDLLCRRGFNGQDTHCCLGVLCEVYEDETGMRTYRDEWRYNLEDLPPKVQEWAGMRCPRGTPEGTRLICLSALNDGFEPLPIDAGWLKKRNLPPGKPLRLDFQQIADLIEAEYERL